jgi:uncharacterized protein YoxC
MSAVFFLIVSGIAGVALTVWGRLVPPDTPATRRGFVAVGGISVLCIIAAGVLNARTQDKLQRTIETVSVNVQKLAEPANVRKDLSVDDILAAAASKLREQDAQIKKLESEVKGITHPTDALYLDNTIIARTVGAVQQTDTNVIFALVVAGQNGLDFTKEYDYQGLKLKCQQPGTFGSMGSFGVMDTRYPRVNCEIVKR